MISSAEATSDKKADLVTVVEFNDNAKVLYPLGDPAGAISVIDSITLDSGTYIGLGIQTAIDEKAETVSIEGAAS